MDEKENNSLTIHYIKPILYANNPNQTFSASHLLQLQLQLPNQLQSIPQTLRKWIKSCFDHENWDKKGN